MISDNIKIVRENIANAAIKAGRRPEDVRLVAVSKTVGPEEVREAYNCGQLEFAENRVQKLCEKLEGLPELDNKISWHLIGQLQTNKIKYCAEKVCLIHSVDRVNLAQELSKFGEKKGFIVHGLIELNISGEESKTGLPVAELDNFLENIAELKNIQFDGLMTMAPLGETEENLHKIFENCRLLSEKIKSMNLKNAPMGELSMGMSADYRIAVEEGATICRVGTAIWQ